MTPQYIQWDYPECIVCSFIENSIGLKRVTFVYSDGEGRTGVFIAMDILVKEGEIIKVINILDCVKTLREQRDNMVQTVVNILY